MKLIRNSRNLKVVLLTATPMGNFADDIVPLINFLRPFDSQIERDKIFTSSFNHEMDFKQGGQEYLRQMIRGYVSHLRGADPMTFAERVEIGIKPKGLIFTKLTQCYMEKLQLETYYKSVNDSHDDIDGLNKKVMAASNFVFPVLSSDKKSIIGSYGREGILLLRNQLKSNYDLI